MTRAERDGWVANNPWHTVHNRVSREWEGVTNSIYDAVTNPIESLQAEGDFIADTAQAAWEAGRQFWGTSGQVWNQISQVTDDQCTNNYTALVKTAIPAAGDALWMLVVPRPNQVLENYLSAKHLRSRRRGLRKRAKEERIDEEKRRRRRAFMSAFSTDEFIAENLPGRAALRGRRAGAATHWLFTGIDVTDAALIWVLFADVTNKFVTQWNSAMHQIRFCSRTQDVILVANVLNPHEFPVANVPCNSDWNVERNKAAECVGGDVRPEFPSRLEINATATVKANKVDFEPNDPGSHTVQWQLFVDNNPVIKGPEVTVPAGSTAEVDITEDVEVSQEFHLNLIKTATKQDVAAAEIKDGTVTAMGNFIRE